MLMVEIITIMYIESRYWIREISPCCALRNLFDNGMHGTVKFTKYCIAAKVCTNWHYSNISFGMCMSSTIGKILPIKSCQYIDQTNPTTALFKHSSQENKKVIQNEKNYLGTHSRFFYTVNQFHRPCNT